MKEIIFCYTCKQWRSTRIWRGRCPLHPERGEKYSTDATTRGCLDYEEKVHIPLHQVAPAKEA